MASRTDGDGDGGVVLMVIVVGVVVVIRDDGCVCVTNHAAYYKVLSALINSFPLKSMSEIQVII